MFTQFTTTFLKHLPRKATSLTLPLLPGASGALACAALAGSMPTRLTVALAADLDAMEQLYGDLEALRQSGCAVLPILLAPGGEDESELAARLQLHERLQRRELKGLTPASEVLVIVTTLPVLLESLPAPQALAKLSLELCTGGSYNFDELIEKLSAIGYRRVVEVVNPCEMAVRGGLFDIWPLDTPTPWRAEFFGSELESLRSFDPVSQRSSAGASSLRLPPTSMRGTPRIKLLELLPRKAAVLWLDHERIAALASQAELRGNTIWEQGSKALARHTFLLNIYSGDPPPPGMGALPLEIAAVPGVAQLEGGRDSHIDLWRQMRNELLADLRARAAGGERVIIYAAAGAAELLSQEVACEAVEISIGTFSGGFHLPGLTVVTQADLYPVRKRAIRSTRAAPRGGALENAADLEPGTLVVHLEHGIGRFLGTTEIELAGERSEVFTIEYADGAKLHVPVSHAHLLSRYVGVAGHSARLHRLGGRRWTRDRSAAEAAVADLAASLLTTQAQRQMLKGYAFDIEPQWLAEFEASFPYQETEDQERVIEQVKSDMASERPMDRLICGDAGYGKTEIAMRAAFIAVMNGRQVAMLVPTTVLAEQHFETFRERMAAYPLKIAVISRFHSQAHVRRTLAGISDGSIDIVIGTHALLGNRVRFKDLGLLVIDEEQRFGVTHKEKLKQVRQMVDVLTLSATPIPRTLYLSMTGARDMSLLQTPPRERVAVETRVSRDSDQVVESAIRFELNRGGQIYFLYNRVLTIGMMRERLSRLVPQARLALAHGQMPDQELAQVMRDFEAGLVDVLLCTTIVESGLDIPRANTIIIHRADRFGIADLYQLRGRVGRAARKGFAWLLLPEYGHVDEEARQRIAALRKHSGLGAGFNLALRDLEIRGGGNLLGAAQSGHIAAIGFGLYCQLLRRTIARLKGEKPPPLVVVDLKLDFLELSPGVLDLGNSACLPYTYVEEEAHRMILYRRLAEAVSAAELRALRQELGDRYGKAPPAVVRLLQLAELRIAAARKGLERIETRAGKVHLYRPNARAPLLLRGALPRLTGQSVSARLSALIKVVKALPASLE